MIDRKALVRRHNPVLRGIDAESPLTVGNGEFAFTADVTGLQTLYDEYSVFPLCTMSQWGWAWHTEPAPNASGRYSPRDVEPTRYEYAGRRFEYAAECYPGSEDAYNWLRHNPHRLNLARIALLWDGREIPGADLSGIRQELDLYTGALDSEFTLYGHRIRIRTVCAHSADVLGVSADVPEPARERLSIRFSFPYGSRRKNASDWQNAGRHTTNLLDDGQGGRLYERILDNDRYFVRVEGGELTLTAAFAADAPARGWNFGKVCADSAEGWGRFWEGGGAVDFSGSKDPRAFELERRAVLSQYLCRVHCAGSIPPQETGLACNSWYGKFHLEMHIMHAGWFPLWGRGGCLEKSFGWYQGILANAKANAARNGFPGARWPKMTGPEGVDSPSRIATLLIWQQPHIIYMLELARGSKPEPERMDFMRRYWELVRETAEFMRGFARFNADTGLYHLTPPLIPAQEEHAPGNALDPVFELCYWRFGLGVAAEWAKTLGMECGQWEDVLAKLARPPIIDGLYPAHRNCAGTFTAFNRDHPSMLFGHGFIPCDGVDARVMSDTADKVLSCWDWDTAWGWDFALTAMTLTRLGRPEAATDALLTDAAKNGYVTSGNNFQRGREDLPLYLPGNGSLLLALSMMLAGFGDKTGGTPGFPKNGMWDVKFEGISPLPY